MAKSTKSLVVEALAGSGKTTTILRGLVGMREASALLCAFNKRIAEELRTRLPKLPRGRVVHVKTMHAQGLAILTQHFPRVKVSLDATENLLNRVAETHGLVIGFISRRAAVRLLRAYKEQHAEATPPTVEALLTFGWAYDLFEKLSVTQTEQTIQIAQLGYAASFDLHARTEIDFCDMVWAPVACQLAPAARYKAVLVDELQDISAPQLALLRLLIAPGGRFIGIGDLSQQIYSWRGSLGREAWRIAQEELHAQVLPMTTTFRCGVEIVAAARELVPALQARPHAQLGRVSTLAWAGLPAALRARPAGTSAFVLSRTNVVLLDCALRLWQAQVEFELNAGRELLDPLFDVLAKLNCRSGLAFTASLDAWRATELARAEQLHAVARAERVEELHGMLALAATYTKPWGIRDLLAKLLAPNQSGVLVSTVHKVKGLEARHVYLMRQTFARHRDRDPEDRRPISEEELNVEYVAITRAIDELIWVDMRKPSAPDLLTVLKLSVEELPHFMRHEILRGDASMLAADATEEPLHPRSAADELGDEPLDDDVAYKPDGI